jgi:hypothetical protein
MVTKRLDGIGHHPATVTEDINVEAVRYIRDKLKQYHILRITVFTRVICALFSSLAAEKNRGA